MKPNLGVGHAVGQKLQDKGLVLCESPKGVGTLAVLNATIKEQIRKYNNNISTSPSQVPNS